MRNAREVSKQTLKEIEKAEQEADIKFKAYKIPNVSDIRSAASKAVKLAVLLLGDKVSEEDIEAQARDFMKLGSKGLNASLIRFAKTQELYAEDAD